MPTILALSRTIKLAAGDYYWRCWIGDPPSAYKDYGNFVGNCGLDPLDDRYQFVDVGLGYMWLYQENHWVSYLDPQF